MVPPSLLSVMSGDDVPADQVTGPPVAVSVISPVEPVPRLSSVGETCSWPAGIGVPVPGSDWPGPGTWYGTVLPRRNSRVGAPAPRVLTDSAGAWDAPRLADPRPAELVLLDCTVAVGAAASVLLLVADDMPCTAVSKPPSLLIANTAARRTATATAAAAGPDHTLAPARRGAAAGAASSSGNPS